MRLSSVLFLLVTAIPALARANGGPVAWTDATAGGGITPVSQATISLTQEQLALRIEDDARHYRARACYWLANPGAAKTVDFGVPLLYTADPYGEETSAEPTAGARAAAESIEIRVGGKRYGCDLRGQGAEVDAVPGARRAWCVAKVTVPAGESIRLALRYRGELLFEDAEFSKSALTVFDNRRLYYELFPAGYWAGKTGKVTVELDLGRFDGLAVVTGDDATTPPPAGHRGDRLSWSFTDVDLARAGALDVRINAEPVLLVDQLTGWNRDHNQGLSVKASSTLADPNRRYAAARLIDGSAATAWCEGATGDGVGEWVELRWPTADEESYCRLEGFAIVPGYAKNATTFRDNNRVTRIALSPCGDPTPLGELAIPDSGRYDRAAVLIRPGELEKPDAPKRTCYRFTIRAVKRGVRFHDSCIGEIAPVINCG